MSEWPEPLSDQRRRAREQSGVIDDVVTMLSPEQQSNEKQPPENDPIEYLPVMRHHLHESLWAMNMALSYIQATDLADSYRQGLTVPKESSLARQLERSHATLSAYLGLLDEEADDESVSEDE
jgi:hypothetical protein